MYNEMVTLMIAGILGLTYVALMEAPRYIIWAVRRMAWSIANSKGRRAYAGAHKQ